MIYYELTLPEHWGCPPSPRWVLAQVRNGLLCSICNRVLPRDENRPVDVIYNRPILAEHVFEVSRTGIPLVDRRLLDLLSPYLHNISVGRALSSDGTTIDTHCTIRIPYDDIVIRRDRPPYRKIDVCKGCGTIRVYPGNELPDYLFALDVRDRHCVFDRIGSIFVSEEVAATGLRRLSPHLTLREVEITLRPQDDLHYPTDPPWVKGVDASIPWDPAQGVSWDALPRIGG